MRCMGGFSYGDGLKPIKTGMFGGNDHPFASYLMMIFFEGGFGICYASGLAVGSGFKTCLARFMIFVENHVETMPIPAAVPHFNQQRGKRPQQEITPS